CGDLGGGDYGLRRSTFLGRGCRFCAVSLDKDTPLAHLHLDRACATTAVRGFDLAGLLSRQRDFLLLIQTAMLSAQIIEQTRLVLLRKLVAFLFAANACRCELLEQSTRWHFQFGGKLFNCRVGHAYLLPRSVLSLTRLTACALRPRTSAL